MPAALAVTFCSEADVQDLLSVLGEQAALDDDDNGVIDATEQARVPKFISYATARVMAYCQGLYDPADLANSWLINEVATILVAWMLRGRRGNPVPAQLKELMFGDGKPENRGAMGVLRDIQAMVLQVDGAGYRNAPWPAWSNVRVDCRYRLRQARAERPISEKTPTSYPQNVDWPAEFTFEI